MSDWISSTVKEIASAREMVRERWPMAHAVPSEIGGWFISLGLSDGRELAYRQDDDIAQLWKDAAANVHKFDTPAIPKPKAIGGLWTMKSGAKIALTEMTDIHLQNTINMLLRTITRIESKIESFKVEQTRRKEERERLAAEAHKLRLQPANSRMFRDDE